MLPYGIVVKEQIDLLVNWPLPHSTPENRLTESIIEMKIESRAFDLTDYKVSSNFTEMKNLEDFTRKAITYSLKQKQKQKQKQSKKAE